MATGTEFTKQKLLTSLRHVRYFLVLMEEWSNKKEWSIFWEAQCYARTHIRDMVVAESHGVLEAFAGGDLVTCGYLVKHEAALENEYVQLGFNPQEIKKVARKEENAA